MLARQLTTQSVRLSEVMDSAKGFELGSMGSSSCEPVFESALRIGLILFGRENTDLFPSVTAIVVVTARSPVTFTAVRNISRRRSIPRMSATPVAGIPTAVSTMARVIIPAPGTPAAPMEATVALKTMVSWSPREIHLEGLRNENCGDSLIQSRSVHVHRGSQWKNSSIRNCLHSDSLRHTPWRPRAADDEDVENARSCAGRIARRNEPMGSLTTIEPVPRK